MSKEKPIDYRYDANGYVLHRVMQTVPLPSYVLNSPPTEVNPSLDVFADKPSSMLPCHTKSAAYLANTYYEEQKHLWPEQMRESIEKNLQKFAALWEVESDVAKYKSVKSNSVKQASEINKPTEDEFAFKDFQNGVPVYSFPINNPENLKKSIKHLLKNASKYPHRLREKIAKNLIVAAENSSSPVSLNFNEWERLRVFANQALCLSKEAADVLRDRVDLLINAEAKTEMFKLAKELDQCPPLYGPAFDELCERVERVEWKDGLYSRRPDVEVPAEALSMSFAKAAYYRGSNVFLSNDDVLSLEKLASCVALKDIAQVFGLEKAVTDPFGNVDMRLFKKAAENLEPADASLLVKMVQNSVEIKDLSPTIKKMAEPKGEFTSEAFLRFCGNNPDFFIGDSLLGVVSRDKEGVFTIGERNHRD